MAIIKPVILEGGQLKTAGVGDQVPKAFVQGLDTSLEAKVDKVAGKGLTDTNYTQAEKTKLAGVAVEATKNRADSDNADKLHTHAVGQLSGLGTAATKNVGTAAGNVMEVRAFGLGSLTLHSGLKDGIGGSGFYGVRAVTENNPIGGDGVAIVGTWANSGYGTGEQILYISQSRPVRGWLQSGAGSTYSTAELYHTGNLLNIGTTATTARSALELGTAATTNNGVGLGQNIINSAVSGSSNISYSGTLLVNTTGNTNTAAGRNALQSNTAGSNNTAVGGNALQSNRTGGGNTAAGMNVLQSNTSGDNNTAAGISALMLNTTGSNNTAVGRNTLFYNTTGANNTAVGLEALLTLAAYNNCGGFGYNSSVTASNQIQLGNSETTVYAYGAVQDRSDARDKAEVRDTVLGLDFICAIRPVDYKLDMREDYRVELGDNPTDEQLEANKLANIQADGTHTRKRYHHGVIAQEVASVIDALGIDFGGFQDHTKIGGDDVLSIGYAEFIAPLIKAVQELSARVKELEGKVDREELDDDSI